MLFVALQFSLGWSSLLPQYPQPDDDSPAGFFASLLLPVTACCCWRSLFCLYVDLREMESTEEASLRRLVTDLLAASVAWASWIAFSNVRSAAFSMSLARKSSSWTPTTIWSNSRAGRQFWQHPSPKEHLVPTSRSSQRKSSNDCWGSCLIEWNW